MITYENVTRVSYNLVNKIKDKTYSENLILIEKADNTKCNLLKSLNLIYSFCNLYS
jgi:hypothetical protein